MPDLLFGPAPHEEAIDFIKSKPVVSRAVFNGLLPELKARAFTIAGLEGNANVMQAVRDRIADLPASHRWDDVKKDIADDITPFLVDPHAPDEQRAAQEAAAQSRAELLLRTHGFQAYQAAQYQVMDRQRDALPFWQYLTMEDDRVRPAHAALDKIVLPQDSPFWQTHFPPWEWGCRCQVVPISQEDRDELAAADQKRAPDNKLVLEGPVATHLEQGTLVRPGRTFDVRPPAEKEGGSGFSWNPATLQMPLDQLKARYDAPVWNEFEAWARRTPLNQGLDQKGVAKTVWEWLGGTPAGPGAPPKLTIDTFIAAHTAQPGVMTPIEAQAVIDGLKQNHGVKVADKVTKIDVAKGLDQAWAPYVEYTTQAFLDLIPLAVLDLLPKFRIRVVPKLGANTLGEYDSSSHVLSLSDVMLQGDAARIEQTIYHELMHWVHLHGPAEYRARIEEHFNLRTAGEKTAPLPNYGSARGKKDKFWDAYMGRQYAGIVDGSEIPTRAMELLTNAKNLSSYWNIPLHRETIKAVLAILFP